MSEATIAALVRHARHEFGARGFAEASVEHIASEVGLTKGSVYYHFGHKKGLFEAVLRDCQRDLVTRIEARAGSSSDPREAVIRGCSAFLDVVIDDELRQVVLVDGPAVLGYDQWRRIDAEFGLGSLKDGLREWAGDRDAIDVDVLAHFVSGALNDLVLFVSQARNPVATHKRVRLQLPVLLGSLLKSASAGMQPRPA
ncbi:MAG TPA: TetR/AcrR family transcriptional regulator [Vicinamibacteria bacterium]|nr:TetR/AcrR family transcriptional regulator [Vicinamibacteria bacterium]